MDKTSKPKKVNLFLTFASDTDRGLKKLFANKWQVCAAKLAKHGANYASSAFLGKKKLKLCSLWQIMPQMMLATSIKALFWRR